MKPILSPRAEELLAERALRPLDDKELKELEQLRVANDESFDQAAASISIATTPIEPMPEHLVDKILAAVPADWKKTTLPGVLVPTPELSHDTMIGVDPRSLLDEASEPADIDIDAPTVLSSDRLAGQRTSTDRSIVVEPLPNESLPTMAAAPSRALTTPSTGGTLPPPAATKAPAVAAAKLPRSSPSRPPKNVATDPGSSTMAERLRNELRSSSEKRAAVAEKTPVPTRLEPSKVEPLPVKPKELSDKQPLAQTLPPRVVLKKPPTGAPPMEVTPPVPEMTVTATTREARTITAQPRPTTNTPFPPNELSGVSQLSGLVPPLTAPLVDLTSRIQQKHTVVRKTSIVPWLAAAAGLLLAGGAVTWALVRDHGPKPVAVIDSPEHDRSAFLAGAIDISKITWTPTKDPTSRGGTTGDVVWSPSQQRGFMRFVGLQVNDPAQFQYQLWIFDRTRDQAFPVDGGVFDVTSTGEVIVAIKPKLHVDDATLFAVTVERPGGVVVSKRDRIVVTAARS